MNPTEYKEYLEKNFGKTEDLHNGYYYIRTADGTEIYCKKELDPSTKISAYIPGIDGSGKRGDAYDASVLRSQMESDNPPNYFTIISPTWDDKNRVLEQAYTIITDNDSTVDGAVVNGFSYGTKIAMPHMDEFLTDHPELINSSGVILVDYPANNSKNAACTVLKDNGVPIIFVSSKSKSSSYQADTNTKTLGALGFNVLGVNAASGGHGQINKDTQANGFVAFLFGDRDDLGTTHSNGKGNMYYQFYVYNSKTGKVDTILDMHTDPKKSALKKAFDGDFTPILFIQIEKDLYVDLEAVNANLFTKAGAFEIKSSLSEASTNNKVLTEIKNLSYGKQYGKVATKYEFVLGKINAIRGNISSSNFLSNLKVQSYRGGTGIPGIINTRINNYFGVIGTLLRNIEKETRAVLTVAEAWMLLDRDIANQLETGNIVELDTPKDLDPPKEEPKDDGKKKSPKTPGTKPPTNPDKKDDPDKKGDPDKPDEEEKKEEPKHTVKVEDDKITQSLEDGSTLELDYKDGKVTSLTYKYEYESEAKAQEAVQSLIAKYDPSDYIGGIYPKGNKVEVVFKENVLSKIDVAKLKENIEKNNDNEKLKLEDLILSFIKKK